MALYFYFNETTGDLVYSDQATYSGSGYTSLGQQTNASPASVTDWAFHSKRSDIRTVTKDLGMSAPIDALTSMHDMFKVCSALISLDLSGFDTSSVTDMYSMFGNCDALTSLDLSGFDTSSVTNMDQVFSGCYSLTSLDLSSFDTSSVTVVNTMFAGCTNLRIIDVSPNMSTVLSKLPSDTYYDAVTRQPYAKADIPGGGTYVRDLADLDLVATMVQTRMGINRVRHALSGKGGLQGQIDEAKRLRPVNEICAGTDLNTLTEPGSWFCDNSTGVTNVPDGVEAEFILYVYSGGGVVAHELHSPYGTWWRWKNEGASPWGVWVRTLAPDGPLPLESGGTGADSADGARTALGLSNLYARAPYVKSKSATGALYAVTVVKTVTSMYMEVMNQTEVRNVIGRNAEWGRDFAVVVNGDEAANSNQVHTLLNINTDEIDARIRSETGGDPKTGAMRLDVLIFAG